MLQRHLSFVCASGQCPGFWVLGDRQQITVERSGWHCLTVTLPPDAHAFSSHLSTQRDRSAAALGLQREELSIQPWFRSPRTCWYRVNAPVSPRQSQELINDNGGNSLQNAQLTLLTFPRLTQPGKSEYRSLRDSAPRSKTETDSPMGGMPR
jgi:hypothetical protein